MTNNDGIVRKVMIDTNVWINYYDESSKHHVNIKKYINYGISTGEIIITKKIKDETKHVFKRDLNRRKDILHEKPNYYVQELNKKLKNINIIKNLDDHSPLYDKALKMYENIWKDLGGRYNEKKEQRTKIKFKYKNPSKNWASLSYDERQREINVCPLPAKNDLNILATTAYVKNTTGNLPVILLTGDSDFWIFGDEIWNTFNVRIISSLDARLLGC